MQLNSIQIPNHGTRVPRKEKFPLVDTVFCIQPLIINMNKLSVFYLDEKIILTEIFRQSIRYDTFAEK